MKITLRKTAAALPFACGLLLSTQSASAQEVYAKVGLLGAGVGYAHSITEHFGVRIDASSAGTINRKGVAGKLRYDADLTSNHLGAYGDWFPFGGGFRLSAGLHSRKLEVAADGRASDGAIIIGNVDIPFEANDGARAKVTWPKVAPYLGIGWGHQMNHGKGFGFIADLGVSFGAPKTELTLTESLRTKLDEISDASKEANRLKPGSVSSIDSDAEIELQRRHMSKMLDKAKVFPHLYVGFSYRF